MVRSDPDDPQPRAPQHLEPPETAPLFGFDSVRRAESHAIAAARHWRGSQFEALDDGTILRKDRDGHFHYLSEDIPDDGKRFGLALSGGGIRSATFCLGVLQALAKAGQLEKVDYLSTVSGGGYIGSWLSAWIYRKGLTAVSDGLSRGQGLKEAPEVTWLRRYSNYLAPRLGMLSADSMTLVATWGRNVVLNLLIIVAFLALFFLLPRMLLDPAVYAMRYLDKEIGYATAWLGFFLFPMAISFHLSRTVSVDARGRIVLMNSAWGVLLIVILPGLLTALMGSIALFSKNSSFAGDLGKTAYIATTLLALSGAIWTLYQKMSGRSLIEIAREGAVFLVAYAGALLIGTLLLRLFIKLIKTDDMGETEEAAKLLTLGPPALLVTFGIVGSVIVGLVGRTYYERTREWWSRMNAWFGILGLAWLAVFALSFYAVPAYRWAHQESHAWFTAIAGASWLTSLLTTLLLPKSAKTSAGNGSPWRPLLDGPLMNVALAIVVAGMLWAVALGVGYVVEYTGRCETESNCSMEQEARKPKPTPAQVELFVKAESGKAAVVTLVPKPGASPSFHDYAVRSFDGQERARGICVNLPKWEWTSWHSPFTCTGLLNVGLTEFLFICCLVTFFVFGLRVDVNKFSLHNMYKTRLIRCYLGASRHDKRKPHPFTGFDERDDVSLCHMSKERKSIAMPVRPVHIVNSAINITQGSNLAWQERKAASFTFSPYHCGFLLGPSTGDALTAPALSAGLKRIGGFRPTIEWASLGDEQKRFTLGMAMATSGAALSANHGAATMPALAFVLTVFNARLGRWSPNPLWRYGWRRASPRLGLLCLLQELFGYSNEASNFVYLSDGGHFDNTGVYELLRRRCTTILAVDASADATRGMEDLANLVRKCRIDFGYKIDFNLDVLGTSEEKQASSPGFVTGTVDYDGTLTGTIIIIKPTLVTLAKLGVDVFAYSRKHGSFPHETTVDQFFSESQFESYRELGERIARMCIQEGGLSQALGTLPTTRRAKWQRSANR